RNANDTDLGAGGPVVLTLPAGSPQNLVVTAGKTTTMYVLNGDNLGGSGDSNTVQTFTGVPMYGAGAFWNDTLYLAGGGYSNPVQAFAFDTTMNLFTSTPTSQSTATTFFPGASPSVSAAGSGNGILWVLDNSQFCTTGSSGCGPAVLHAFDATNLAKELWKSSQASGDAAGNAVKFTVPTVANGKVYV